MYFLFIEPQVKNARCKNLYISRFSIILEIALTGRMKTNDIRNCIFLVSIFLLAGCNGELSDEVQLQMGNVPDEVDYNFHVKPILSDRCFACHGPDAQKRKGDLRLDTEEGAYAALASGAGHAIVPGNIQNSELVDRILSDDPERVMPPPESNLNLNAIEKATIIKWIEQGAVYKPHWAFTKPKADEVPAAGDGWASNEIDRFISAKLEQSGISPAPEAKKAQLIRRLYFDITGLPPTLEELDRLSKDNRPDYYERLVDSLLNLPAYGERMAAHWLDVARFADSEGYLDDFHHTFWPYRDWVIEAFNKNLPYDRFILWQVGGDQLPNAGTEQILATAFNRHHKQNSEGGIIPEEFRVEYVADRTNTVGAAFMGLTLGCARCHDHKYDPISQENYFQLFSFFNSTVERGDGIFAYNSIENGQMVPNKLSMNAGPVLPLPDDEVAAVREYLLKSIAEQQDSIEIIAETNINTFQEWVNQQNEASILSDVVDKATVAHLTFDDMANGQATDLAQGNATATYWGDVKAVPGKKGKAISSHAQGQFVSDGSRVSFERMEPFTISFWINIPKAFNEAHVIYNGNNRIQGYRGWDVVLDSLQLHFRLNHAHPYQSLDITHLEDLPLNQWVHFVWTYDGSSKAEGMQLYRDGELIPIQIARNYLYRSTKPYLDTRATVYMPYKGMIIGNRHYDQDFTGGLLDEVRILNRESGPLVAKYLYDAKLGITTFEDALKSKTQSLHLFYDLFIDQQLESARSAMRETQLKEIITIDTVQEIMVMGDWDNERPTYILERGVYDAYGKRVKREVPSSILPWLEELPRNRLGLGQWLIHPDHPLTARVAVNQMWYLMFGRGIVETVEDFGNQGALPSHPALLDWLALDFQRNGWDVKRLIRQMVTSATYRQSSKIRPELEEIDPDNYLLARGPRYRRSAEMIRDNILAVSGLLDPKIGGPSVFPYQAPGLWKEVMTHGFFPDWETDYENGLYRRSIYTFWKRNMPPPGMLIFDAAHRGECQVRRQISNTPLQALVLLNDVQMIEGCRVLAERLWKQTHGEVPKATVQAFRALTGRMPTDKERQLLLLQYTEELAYFREDEARTLTYLDMGHQKVNANLPANEVAALTRVVNTVLNTTESYFKN